MSTDYAKVFMCLYILSFFQLKNWNWWKSSFFFGKKYYFPLFPFILVERSTYYYYPTFQPCFMYTCFMTWCNVWIYNIFSVGKIVSIIVTLFILPVISVYLFFLFVIFCEDLSLFLFPRKRENCFIIQSVSSHKIHHFTGENDNETVLLLYTQYQEIYIKYLNSISLITPPVLVRALFLLVHFAKWIEYKLCVCNVMCVQCKFVWWSWSSWLSGGSGGCGDGNLDDHMGISRFACKFSTFSSSLFPK